MCFFRKKKNKQKQEPKKTAPEVKKEEPVVKEEPKKEAEPKKEVAPKKEAAPKKEEPVKKQEGNVKYHISQNKDDKSEYFKQWRVRKQGSNKTIKYFKTQKEAIDYAKTLAKNADTDIVIHRVDGKIRKQNY